MSYTVNFTDGVSLRLDTRIETVDEADEVIALIEAMTPFVVGTWKQAKANNQIRVGREAAIAKAPKEVKPEPSEDITREPKQAKALRAEKALKDITPAPPEEPQETAVITPVEFPDLTKPAPVTEARPKRNTGGLTVAEVERREAIVRELYPDMNYTNDEIGRRAGIDRWQVTAYAKRLGLPLRGRGYHGVGGQRSAGNDGNPATEVPSAAVPAPTNGHVFTLHGVSLSHDAISFNGKELPITESQHRLLLAVLRAAPHPIGVPHLIPKVYPGKRREEAETVFGIVVKDLTKNLPTVDLGLNEMKGIGIALTGSDA